MNDYNFDSLIQFGDDKVFYNEIIYLTSICLIRRIFDNHFTNVFKLLRKENLRSFWLSCQFRLMLNAEKQHDESHLPQ